MNLISLLSKMCSMCLIALALIRPPAAAGVIDADLLRQNRVPLAQLLAHYKDLSLTQFLQSDIALADDHGLKFYFITYKGSDSTTYFYLIDVNLIESHQRDSLFYFNGEGTFPSSYWPAILMDEGSNDERVYANLFDPRQVDMTSFALDSGYEVEVDTSGAQDSQLRLKDEYHPVSRAVYDVAREEKLKSQLMEADYWREVKLLSEKINFFRKRNGGPKVSAGCAKLLMTLEIRASTN